MGKQSRVGGSGYYRRGDRIAKDNRGQGRVTNAMRLQESGLERGKHLLYAKAGDLEDRSPLAKGESRLLH